MTTSNPARHPASHDLLGRAPRPFAEHAAMARAYPGGRMTVGAITPIEGYDNHVVPTMAGHLERVQQAERAGFASVWVRDVPLLDPHFGDAGQVFDPWVYLGYLAAHTESITLGTASTVVPLRHPLHLAKSAASVDQLTGGRLLLGIATGDRPVEFPAFGLDPEDRGERFRESVALFRAALENHFPGIRSTLGTLDGNVDLIPKSVYERIPLLMTGRGRQELEWIAAETDGWMYYTPPFQQQAQTIQQWRRLTDGRGPRGFKPFAQATVIDLRAEPHASPRRIHQGFSVGREPLLEMMGAWQQVGIDQLMINFKHNHRPVAEVLDELAEYVLPEFPPGRAEDAAAADRGRSA